MAAPLNIAVAYLTPIWQTCQYVEGPSESYLKLVEPATLWWVTQKLAATTHCHSIWQACQCVASKFTSGAMLLQNGAPAYTSPNHSLLQNETMIIVICALKS